MNKDMNNNGRLGEQDSGFYSKCGVDIDYEAVASGILYEAAKATWVNRTDRLGQILLAEDSFSGTRSFDIGQLPTGTRAFMTTDGVGTKSRIYQREDNHAGNIFDAITMNADDCWVRGAEPIACVVSLDVTTVGNRDKDYLDCVRNLASGYEPAAAASGVAIVNGEIAQLGDTVGGYHGAEFKYIMNVSTLWVQAKEKLFTGMEIKEGDTIIGLHEPGTRSNGMSAIRKAAKQKFGDEWHLGEYDGRAIGDMATVPSTSYSKLMRDLYGGYDEQSKVEIHGFVHVTGGGMPEKLGRVLRASGLGADIYSPFEISPIFNFVQKTANVPAEEMYKTFGMNIGGMIIVPEKSVETVKSVAETNSITVEKNGTVENRDHVRIRNMSLSGSQYLSYPLMAAG